MKIKQIIIISACVGYVFVPCEPIFLSLSCCMIFFAAELVVVPETLLEELADLRIAFAQLLCEYEKELRNSPEAQEKFIEFLPRLLRNRKGFSSDQSFQSNFDKLIDEEVSLFNIHYLKRICSIFSEDVW